MTAAAVSLRPAPRRRSLGTVVAGAGLVAIYLLIRLRVAGVLPYFLDEGIYAGYSYAGAHSTGELFVSLTIAKQPLQAWLGIPWQWLGANPLDAMRLVSVSAGLLTLVPLYLLGRRLGGRVTGCVAAGLAVVIPFLAVTDAVGIEEPLVLLVMASALVLQLRLAERPDLRTGTLLGAIIAAGLLTKGSCEAAIVLIPFSLLCFDWRPANRRARILRWLLALLPSLAGVVIAELLMRGSRYWAAGVAYNRVAPLTRTLGSLLHHPFTPLRHAWHVFEPTLTGYVTVPLILMTVAGFVLVVRERPRLAVLLMVWVLLPAAAAFALVLTPYPRHLMYVLAPMLPLMALAFVRGAEALRAHLRPRAAPGVIAALAVLLLVPGLLLDARVLAHPATARYPGLDDFQYVTGVPAGGAWPSLVRAIRARARPGPVGVFVAIGDPNVVRYLLSADPDAPRNRYHVIEQVGPAAARAQFAIVDQSPFGNPPATALLTRERFTVVGRFHRLRSPVSASLLERPGS